MKGIFQTFYKKPKPNRKVFELSDGVFIALYEQDTFVSDMGVVLQKAYRKYGETRQVLVLDVGANGEEPWMKDIMPGVLKTTTTHLGPYYLVPSLSSVFEVCADICVWLESGVKVGAQHIVLIIARNELCDDYRPLTAIALVASAYLTHVRLYENGISALDFVKKKVKEAGLCSDRQLQQDTSVANLYQYLRFFTMLRINKKFPNNRPLQMAKILVQGTVLIDDQPWNPIVRIYQAGRKDAKECTTIMQRDNGLGFDVMIGMGYANFVLDEIIAGDVILAFEHWVPISDDTKPLFTIARHTGFLQPPYHRVLFKEVELAPSLASKITVETDFGVDLFFENVDAPQGVDADDFSDEALGKYADMYGNENAELIGRVADLYDVVEDIVIHAPDTPPPSLKAIAEMTTNQSADFVEEIRQKNAEREKRNLERKNILEGSDVKRKAKLLEEVLGIDVGADAVDEFMQVFKQYNEEVANETQDKLSRQKTAKQLLDKTFLGKRSSIQVVEESSEEDGFSDIAQSIDEEDLDEADVLKHKISAARMLSKDSDEEDVSDEDSERDAAVLQNAVQVLLKGVKKSGRSDRFRADDVLKKSADGIDESDIIEQITGALQELVAESKAGLDGSSRKFFSTQEVVDKVKVMRTQGDGTSIGSSPLPPKPPSAPPSGLPPPRPPLPIPALAGKQGAPPPPPPPPPPPSGGLRPPTKAPGASSTAPPPPPPPRPPGGATLPKPSGLPPPPPGLGGPKKPGAPPPPPAAGAPKRAGGPPPPPPPPGKGGGGAPPPPPPPPPPRAGGAPPPPPPSMGGLRKPGPPVPPPLGKGGLKPPNGNVVPGAPTAPVQAAPPPVKPQKRNDTKRLNWNPISNIKVKKTLYASEEFQRTVGIDDDIQKELLDQFSNRPPPKVFDKEKEEKKEVVEGPKTAGILEQKKIMNTMIMLRKFEAKPREIAKAVRQLDPLSEVLTLENVNALFVNEFKQEEIEMAKNFAAPEEEVEKLNEAEALAYYVARVPRWSVKITSMVTMRTADEVYLEIKTSIMDVVNASKQVLASKRFERVLASVLAIGNFLNAGTAKGSARGFRLEALPKLCETKAKERGVTLLHYITGMLAKKDADALMFPEDMEHVVKARRVAKEDIAKELTTFQRAVAVMGREITAMVKENEMGGGGNVSLPSTPPPPKVSRRSSGVSESMLNAMNAEMEGEKKEEKSVDVLKVAKERYAKAETAVTELQTLHEEMLRAFSQVATHLGEDVKNAKVEEFFATLWEFMKTFEQSVKENKEREEEVARKERMKKRQEEDEERRKKRASMKIEANLKDTNME